jgi:hypothetical protein
MRHDQPAELLQAGVEVAPRETPGRLVELTEALVIRGAATPHDWERYEAMSLLGEPLPGEGRHSDAEPLVLAGYEGMKAREARIAVLERTRLRQAAEWVVHLYEAGNQPEQAAAWKVKLGMPDLPADVFAQP